MQNALQRQRLSQLITKWRKCTINIIKIIKGSYWGHLFQKLYVLIFNKGPISCAVMRIITETVQANANWLF